MFKKLAASALFALSSLTAQAGVLVDVELQLLADVSGSVDSTEYNLQLKGYADAFRSTDVQNAILAGTNGGIAVQYIEWSTSQQVQLDWTLIDSVAAANAFADALENVARAFQSMTNLDDAIDFGVAEFANNGFDSSRQVIDVSGDGKTNNGGNATTTSTARDNAFNAGIDTINGITIGNESGLQQFYQDNVVGGYRSFHLHAATFADFQDGIERKLIREITSVPAPGTLAVMGLALFAFARIRKS